VARASCLRFRFSANWFLVFWHVVRPEFNRPPNSDRFSVAVLFSRYCDRYTNRRYLYGLVTYVSSRPLTCIFVVFIRRFGEFFETFSNVCARLFYVRDSVEITSLYVTLILILLRDYKQRTHRLILQLLSVRYR